jgi:hypothetical protein
VIVLNELDVAAYCSIKGFFVETFIKKAAVVTIDFWLKKDDFRDGQQCCFYRHEFLTRKKDDVTAMAIRKRCSGSVNRTLRREPGLIGTGSGEEALTGFFGRADGK